MRHEGIVDLRYLVTGGAGFIGSNIVDELVRRGHDVVVLDDLSAGKEENLTGVREKIEFSTVSITDLAAVQAAAKGADYVIHLAERTSVPRSVQSLLETNSVNIDGTLNVLVDARDAKARRFVYAASSSAYGETPTPPKIETMQPAPISPYGVTKYVGELYAQVFGPFMGLRMHRCNSSMYLGPDKIPLRNIRACFHDSCWQ
jgi:nucleoside-diphosphate-sugar epimerase